MRIRNAVLLTEGFLFIDSSSNFASAVAGSDVNTNENLRAFRLLTSAGFFPVIKTPGGFSERQWRENVKAQGSALGKVIQFGAPALKARNQVSRSNDFAPSALVTFDTVDLGRWPRLFHLAPSALC